MPQLLSTLRLFGRYDLMKTALVEGVTVKNRGAANFSISDNGRLVYALGGGGFGRSLVWVDREGREEPVDAPLRNYVYPRISPDGARVLLDVRDEENDLWVWDLAVETLTRLTFDAANDQYGHWMPDGQRVVFSSARDGSQNVYWKAADGTGTVDRLTESDTPQFVNAVTPDGTRVVMSTGTGAARVGATRDLVTASFGSDRAIEALLNTEFSELNAALSPDGQWLSYQSDESGRFEIYVRPFPDVEAGRSQVSISGGRMPVWGPDGRELFYVEGQRLVTVPVQTDPSFTRGNPEVMFEGDYVFSPDVVTGRGRTYDVAPDGQRFLMITGEDTVDGEAGRAEIHVALNWAQELERLVPTN